MSDEGRPWVLCQNEWMSASGWQRKRHENQLWEFLPSISASAGQPEQSGYALTFGSVRPLGWSSPSTPSLFCSTLNCYSALKHQDGTSTVTSGATHLFLLPAKAQRLAWQMEYLPLGEMGQISESNNWETAAVFLPHHPGALLKHTLTDWRFSSVKAIPCTWGEIIVPSRLRSAARSLCSSLWQGTRQSLVWETQRGRLGIRTFLGTHLRGFLTVAREQFSKVSFYMLLIKHEKNREAVLYFHAVSLFTATHWDCTGFLRSSRFPHHDCSVCLTESPLQSPRVPHYLESWNNFSWRDL